MTAARGSARKAATLVIHDLVRQRVESVNGGNKFAKQFSAFRNSMKSWLGEFSSPTP